MRGKERSVRQAHFINMASKITLLDSTERVAARHCLGVGSARVDLKAKTRQLEGVRRSGWNFSDYSVNLTQTKTTGHCISSGSGIASPLGVGGLGLLLAHTALQSP